MCAPLRAVSTSSLSLAIIPRGCPRRHEYGLPRLDRCFTADLDEFAAHEPVDPAAHYWRIAPMLETGAAKCQWLNRVVGAGLGQMVAGTVIYGVHAG